MGVRQIALPNPARGRDYQGYCRISTLYPYRVADFSRRTIHLGSQFAGQFGVSTNEPRGTKTKAGIFAAIYSASDEPYQAYCQFVAKILRNIKNNHDETLANTENSVQSRASVAMRSAAQILDFQRSLRAGVVSTSPENVKYFLSDTDELLFGRPDRPATVKVKFNKNRYL